MDGQHLNDDLAKYCWNCFGERLKAFEVDKESGWMEVCMDEWRKCCKYCKNLYLVYVFHHIY